MFNLVFVGTTLRHERYHESISLSLPSQSLGQHTNKQNQMTQKNNNSIQLNKPKQLNTI